MTTSIQDLISRRRSLLLLSSNTDVKNGITLLEKRKGTIRSAASLTPYITIIILAVTIK